MGGSQLGTGLNVEKGREGFHNISFIFMAEGRPYILLNRRELQRLETLPEIEDTAERLVRELMGKTNIIFLTGAMYSGKSDIFNKMAEKIFTESLELKHFPAPMVIGRASKARKRDSIDELEKLIGASYEGEPSKVPFNRGIQGPLDFLKYVSERIGDNEADAIESSVSGEEGEEHKKPIKSAWLEEVSVMLFSRSEYKESLAGDEISNGEDNEEKKKRLLTSCGVPEEFQEEYLEALSDEDEAQGLGNEVVLMAKILEGKGIKLVMTGVDRFFSGVPWEPVVQLINLAQEAGRRVIIHRRYPRCLGCGAPAVISAVTEDYHWQLDIGNTFYELHPFMLDLNKLVEAIEPRCVPLCEDCNDCFWSGIGSGGRVGINWPILRDLGFFKPPELDQEFRGGLIEAKADFWQSLPTCHEEVGKEGFERLREQIMEIFPDAVEQLPSFEDLGQAWKIWQAAQNGRDLHPLVLVDGVLGSGKSELAKSLAEAKNGSWFEEEWTPLDESGLLGEFYDLLADFTAERITDEGKRRLNELQHQLQTWFLANTLRRMTKAIIASENETAVVDVSLLGDAVYELTHMMLGIATQENFKQYIELRNNLWRLLPPVNWRHLYNGIYSMATAFHRVGEQRRRKIEEEMPPGYLALLLDNCFKLMEFLSTQGKIPVVAIDCEVGNFSKSNRHERGYLSTKIWKRFEEALRDLKAQATAVS